jgi:hypothetical protein
MSTRLSFFFCYQATVQPNLNSICEPNIAIVARYAITPVALWQ